jgi:hypothetical protein
MCPPGPLSVTLATISRSSGSTSLGGKPARSRRSGTLVSIVVTSTTSPDAIRSTGVAVGL